MDLIQGIAITASGIIALLVIELIRRNLLKERYSLIWLATAGVLILFSVWRNLLDIVALSLGIHYPPSFLFLLAIGFLIALLLHFSSVISIITDKNRRLAQEVGMLKARLEEMEVRIGKD